MGNRGRAGVVGMIVFVAACGSSGESSSTEVPASEAPVLTDAPPATDPPPPPTEAPATDPPVVTDPPPPSTEATTSTAATTTTTLPPAVVLGDPAADGSIPVVIDGSRLAPLYDEFVAGDDPFYLVHTQQADIFVGVELYTVFGASWTGELGTFRADCTTHGICVYLDPDGVGPLPGGGPGVGTITVEALDAASVITIDDVTITADDGKVYTLSGVTLTG